MRVLYGAGVVRYVSRSTQIATVLGDHHRNSLALRMAKPPFTASTFLKPSC